MYLEPLSLIASKALDGLFARQAATANNIANASSDGFVPSRVSFEEALRDAAAVHPGDDARQWMGRVASVNWSVAPAQSDALDGVKLDQEIATASETSVRYALLTGMLDRTLQMQSFAVKGA
ncbi:flagellar basal body rod protein FlgB [Caballeronia pedi]|uniref:Flagellar basal body rod protein FlgB n=1 Tax=Caballeronia pedi TaxID=1777141 RepID=A0A158C0R7_9BURK|nr:hypothetical protein [Caballeronia pedi]SAK75840.1 flagellar basal body rod protein FlgB [Caballeronia pedi]